MPLLSAFLDASSGSVSKMTKNLLQPRELLPTLVDFELLTSEADGKRTVGFGWFAGGTACSITSHATDAFLVAGVLESLSAMAHSHLEIGVASPFLVRFFTFVSFYT